MCPPLWVTHLCQTAPIPALPARHSMAPGTEWEAQHVCRDAPCWRIDLQPGWEEAAPVWRQAGVLKQLCDGKGAAEGRGGWQTEGWWWWVGVGGQWHGLPSRHSFGETGLGQRPPSKTWPLSCRAAFSLCPHHLGFLSGQREWWCTLLRWAELPALPGKLNRFYPILKPEKEGLREGKPLAKGHTVRGLSREPCPWLCLQG